MYIIFHSVSWIDILGTNCLYTWYNSCYWNESTPSVWIIQTSLVTDVNEIVFTYMLFLKTMLYIIFKYLLFSIRTSCYD